MEEEEKKDFKFSIDEIEEFEKLINLSFNDEKRKLMQENLTELDKSIQTLRKVELDNAVLPSIQFNPYIHTNIKKGTEVFNPTQRDDLKRPDNLEDLAYSSIPELAYYIKFQIISSYELTEMYINRLKRYDKILECVITFMEEEALQKAKVADEEILSGAYRGILHGIPYGVKDLLAYPNYKTTWGATPYQDQELDVKAAVIEKFENAGAILIAKLSLGALAWGDVWFDGVTKTPWNLEEGSSGSSAGSSSATAAGLVAFAIGSETYGSIVSPSTKCGTTGLRPSYGRVSRYGAMALSWSMDKLGPICRSVEDCAIVFNTIHGVDKRDPSTIESSFSWDVSKDISKLRVGYLKTIMDKEYDFKSFDDAVLDKFKELSIDLIPVELPDYPVNEMALILWAEAAAAFEQLTNSGDDDLLVRQEQDAWPNFFRVGRFIPAVEYIKANRLRTSLIQAMNDLFNEVDVLIAPSFSDTLIMTNLTGHPCVVLPTGIRENKVPSSITFISNLLNEEDLMYVAKLYQDNTKHHIKTPQDILDKAYNQ